MGGVAANGTVPVEDDCDNPLLVRRTVASNHRATTGQDRKAPESQIEFSSGSDKPSFPAELLNGLSLFSNCETFVDRLHNAD
jgi:hypothetical protein